MGDVLTTGFDGGEMDLCHGVTKEMAVDGRRG